MLRLRELSEKLNRCSDEFRVKLTFSTLSPSPEAHFAVMNF